MQVLDVAFKDIRQSFRNRGAIIFMFVVPVLVTVLFAFMFGNIAGDDEEFSLPQTAVLLINDDGGEIPFTTDMPAGADVDMTDVRSMGDLLAQLLQGEQLTDLMAITEMEDAAAARTAVDNQEAGVAIIIPPNFSDALTAGEETAAVELYADPTLTLGPAIVESVVQQFVDGFAASNISIGVTMEQLDAVGVSVTGAMMQEVIQRNMASINPEQANEGLVATRAPAGSEAQNDEMTQVLALILAGMMVFYAFFTGANMLHSILTEEENGTLQRLFTTPTTQLTIFSGKFLAALVVLVVQVTVLLAFGWLVFDIYWGELPLVVIAGVGLVISSATTGLFLISLLKNTRQAGAIFGGLLTLTGMLGMISVFTAGAPNTPPALNTISLLVPQGWAIRGLRQSMENQDLTDVALSFGAILVWSVLFFVIGQSRLRERFA